MATDKPVDPSVHLPKFQHNSLPPGNRHFRLCSLLPGKFSDQIRLNIKTHLLTPENHPHYEALSYVCGNPEKPEQATIIDPETFLPSKLALTFNLREALQYVRYEDRSRTLWVDAICIDQDDFAERGAQIQKMSSIYKLASRVMIWLSPEKDNSAEAFADTCTIGSQIRLDPYKPRVHSLNSNIPWSEHMLLLQGFFGESPRCEAFGSLFNRGYFERLWVRQEAFLGRERAQIQCGHSIKPWVDFERGAFAWAFSALDDSKGAYCVSSMWMNLFRQDTHIMQLLWSTRSTKCLDPRDKVFAILGMADPQKFPAFAKILPDYHKPVSEVYAEAFQAVVRDAGILELLVEAGVSRSSVWRPTWSPDWDRDADECLSGTRYADAGAACDKECIHGLLMHVEGRIAATVATVIYADAGELDVLAFLERVLADVDLQEPYSGGGDMLTAYAWILTGGNIAGYVDSYTYDDLSLEDVRSILRAVKSRQYVEDDSKLDAIHNHLENRSVIITDTGLVGVAPEDVEPGDAIAIILGCSQPMVLIPCGGQMKVVGNCYIHGLNWGEALLGPLPEDTRMIQTAKAEKALKFVTGSGDEFYLDPRISWHELEVDPSQANEYKLAHQEELQVKTGEQASIRVETRCWKSPDAEYFRNHGVELETITLI